VIFLVVLVNFYYFFFCAKWIFIS